MEDGANLSFFTPNKPRVGDVQRLLSPDHLGLQQQWDFDLSESDVDMNTTVNSDRRPHSEPPQSNPNRDGSLLRPSTNEWPEPGRKTGQEIRNLATFNRPGLTERPIESLGRRRNVERVDYKESKSKPRKSK